MSHPLDIFVSRALFGLIITVMLGMPVFAADDVPQTPPVLLQMIRDDAVQDELRLNSSQRQDIRTALVSIDGEWFRARNLPSDDQHAKIAELTEGLQQQLASILDRQQAKRLRELQRQALGTRMLLRDDVADALNLSADRREWFRAAFSTTDRKATSLQQQLRKGELAGDAAQRAIQKLQAEERKLLVDQLSLEQKNLLGALTGTAFDFSKVKRMYPLAPELTSQGVTWVQGGPLTLEELKGKVVAVHYYAFQCINCQRNLPHYKAWHADYADKGLVVIGIQTPETSAERNLARVTAAAKNDGIEYPLLLDSASQNWKTWSNTMWPTVYLIDKQGFIRRWWQGELNWKETSGEKQMRTTIEQLLAE